MKKVFGYFSIAEAALWSASVAAITISFFVFDRTNILAFAASLVGVTALIFVAKGNPVGQALTIAFSIMYGIISLSFAYYGEMITYLGMTLPMAVFSLISWLRNPYDGRRSQVAVNRLRAKEILLMFVAACAVTAGFYFILAAFDTANIVPSTISVTTSFLAVYLTFRRSALYALAYAANDVVLMVLWVLATAENLGYLSVVVCFSAFFANDIYGFISWRRISKEQLRGTRAQTTVNNTSQDHT